MSDECAQVNPLRGSRRIVHEFEVDALHRSFSHATGHVVEASKHPRD
jgi:hypothetical protein